MRALGQALLTAWTGKEHRCVEDILNALLPYDQTVEVRQLTKASFLISSSKLGANTIVSFIRRTPPSCAAHVFPVHASARSDIIEISNVVKNLVEADERLRGKRFYADCRVRSGEFECRAVEIAIGTALRGQATVDFKSPDFVILVNVFKDLALISILKEVDKNFRKGLSV